MNTRTVMTIAAVVILIFALGLLLAAVLMATLYGNGDGPSEILLPRYFDLTLLSPGLLS